MNGKIQEAFGKISKNVKWQRVIIAAGIIGIALIFLSNYIGTDSGREDDKFSVTT